MKKQLETVGCLEARAQGYEEMSNSKIDMKECTIRKQRWSNFDISTW